MWYATLLVVWSRCCTCCFTATPETFAQKLERLRRRLRRSAELLPDRRSMRRRRPISISIRHSVCWPRCWWRRSPGPLCNGRRYSAQQNGEIKGARSFQNQTDHHPRIADRDRLAACRSWRYAFEHAIGTNFLYVAGCRLLGGIGREGKFNGVFLWPNIVAMALAGSPIIVVLIAFGYILNSFQIVNNCYIGMTRVMVAMSLDRLLPEWVSRVSDRLHTPVNAHLAYFPRQHPGDPGLQLVEPAGRR